MPTEVSSEGVSIPELADELQTYRATIFKIAKRLGVSTSRRRSTEKHGQEVAVVAAADAERIRVEIRGRGGRDPSATDDATGVFYVVQLEPDHDPHRIKVGFTVDIDGRLQKHRCTAPFARVVKTWPCQRHWERTAIDSVCASAQRLHTEVFRAESVAAAVERADAFFSVMPTVAVRGGESTES